MIKKILVIDDEVELCESLGQTLASLGFEVLMSNIVTEVPEILKKNPIDLVISDVRMPVMNGVELLETVKKTGIKMPHWVFISGQPFENIEKRAAELGVTEFISKPFTSSQIKKMISHLSAKRAAS